MPIAGSAGHPVNEPLTVIQGGDGTPIPDAPTDLKDVGREAWSRLWTVGRAWLSNEAHYDLMVMVCRAMDRQGALEAQAGKLRSVMVKGSMGQTRVHPLFDTIERGEKHIAELLKRADFEPDGKRKPVRPKESKLESLIRRSA